MIIDDVIVADQDRIKPKLLASDDVIAATVDDVIDPGKFSAAEHRKELSRRGDREKNLGHRRRWRRRLLGPGRKPPTFARLVAVDSGFRFEGGGRGLVVEHVGGQRRPVLQPQPCRVVEKTIKWKKVTLAEI